MFRFDQVECPHAPKAVESEHTLKAHRYIVQHQISDELHTAPAGTEIGKRKPPAAAG